MKIWAGIRSEYELKPDYINLENGYYNILPKEILENFIHIREITRDRIICVQCSSTIKPPRKCRSYWVAAQRN